MQIATTASGDLIRREFQSSGVPARPTLLFFHIGKTGGTSLTRFFRALAHTSHVQSAPDDYSQLESPDDIEFPNFISGHYKVRQWLHRLPPSWRTMVVIRDPIQHLLSSYWHIRTHPPVIDDPDLCHLIEATGRSDLGVLLRDRPGECFELHFDNPQTRFILNKVSGPLDADDLARAIALLGSLTYVGTTERLAAFASHVAALMPWATGWEAQALPHAMVNPLNTLRTEEIPRRLLRHILAATEMDAELYQRARQLQSERVTLVPALIATRSVRAEPTPVVRAIPVTDLIRVFPVKLQSVRIGHEFIIDGDDIQLHPPGPEESRAAVAIDGIQLAGHSEMAGCLVLANEHAAPVLFGIDLSYGGVSLVSASFKVLPGQPLDVRLRFSPTTGPARLELRTEMALGDSNAFAWANFTRLTIR
jgi:hypothetical protein